MKPGSFGEQGVEELGNTPTLELLGSDTSTGQSLGTFVQAQLQENLGAEVEINTQPFDRRLELQREGEFQFGFSGWGADYNDPMSFMDLFVSDGGFNDISFSNDRYDQLIQEAKTSGDNQLRMDNMSEAEQIIIEEEAAIAPQYFQGYAQAREVGGGERHLSSLRRQPRTQVHDRRPVAGRLLIYFQGRLSTGRPCILSGYNEFALEEVSRGC